MIFDIINPSDSYTLESDDFEMACVAALYLGLGKYGLKQVDGDLEMPVFFIAGDEYIKKWWQEEFHHPFETKDELKEPVAKVLDSVVIGSPRDRKVYFSTLKLLESDESRNRFREEWDDLFLSSLNDIGKSAHELATRLRQK